MSIDVKYDTTPCGTPRAETSSVDTGNVRAVRRPGSLAFDCLDMYMCTYVTMSCDVRVWYIDHRVSFVFFFLYRVAKTEPVRSGVS